MAAVRQGHPLRGNRQINYTMEAASLPRAPPAVKAPIHTQHIGQRGDDGLIELIPWSWPGRSHLKPRSHHSTSRVVQGKRARFWPEVHIALVEGQHRDAPLACTVGLTNGERPDLRMPLWPYRLNRDTRYK